MKKYMILCAGLCAAMAFTCCKSSESAYKKAYEKAKAQEAAAVEDQHHGGGGHQMRNVDVEHLLPFAGAVDGGRLV